LTARITPRMEMVTRNDDIEANDFCAHGILE